MFYTLMFSIILGGFSRIRWGTLYYIRISQPGKRMFPYVPVCYPYVTRMYPYVTHKAVAQRFHTHKIVISFYFILRGWPLGRI